jgi:acyl-lipid omega-6 desaturase (Delta-12 desaturase)
MIKAKPDHKAWMDKIAKYNNPELKKSIWQLVNSIGPFLMLWSLMLYFYNISPWISLALTIPAAGFMVRVFIIFHDCGHGSFFKSRKANHIVGSIAGILTFTPYFQWRYEHAVHHATSGDLDKRGTGDVKTMTVDEYNAASFWKRVKYRIYRNPFVMFVIGPLFMFLIVHRLIDKKGKKQERWSVVYTNIVLFAIAVIMYFTIGLKAYFLMQIPILLMAGGAGIWLFYVQHQFEDVYWERSEKWDYVSAAIDGSSFYKLPKFFQWFTGNIGFHHIHHVSSKIPNYYLEKCHVENEVFKQVKPVTLRTSFKSAKFRLWDEAQQRLVGFAGIRKKV